MKNILCRGRRKDNGEWIEGFAYEHGPPLQCTSLSNEQSKWFILNTAFADWNMPRQVEMTEVVADTIGRYTGLPDKNGKKIFDGDICKDSRSAVVHILWGDNYQWACKIIKGGALSVGLIFPLWHWDNCLENGHRTFEIVGNIYDNPELLHEEII